MQIRLNKYIAQGGFYSRRAAEDLIVGGRVKVNGEVVLRLGSSIEARKDVVLVDDKEVRPAETYRYVAFNKPTGIVCTRAAHPGEKTVYDVLPGIRDLVIAGRLDMDSDGLVLLTNEGELVNQLTHPKFGHTKEYEVTTAKPLDDEAVQRINEGIALAEGKATFDQFIQVSPGLYRVVLHQGWKRQIRRMFTKVGASVTKLTRVRIQRLELGSLIPGGYRTVKRTEITG